MMKVTIYAPFKDESVARYLSKECYTIFSRKSAKASACKDISKALAYQAQADAWRALYKVVTVIEEEMSAPGST